MGPVPAATMVQEAAADPSSKKLHPFFVKGANIDPPRAAPPTDSAPAAPHDDGSASGSGEGEGGGPAKRRKTGPSVAEEAPEAKKQRRKRGNGGASLGGTILDHLCKPTPPAAMPAADEKPADQSINDVLTPPLSDVSAKPADQAAQPVDTTTTQPGPAPSTPPAKAKKVLKFNPKTGTLGSPPKPKTKSTPSRIVSIKYGRDDDNRKEIGDKITQILDGKLQILPTKRRPGRPRKSRDAVPAHEAAKAPHPLFVGKKPQPAEQNKTADVSKKPRNSVFMSTPVSPRKPRMPPPSNRFPQFGIKSMGTKIPGAMLPLWPALGMSHVRGDDVPVRSTDAGSLNNQSQRKSKGQVVRVSRDESVLGRLVDRIDFGRVRDTLPKDDKSFDPPPPELRLPVRHFESGRKLQKRIRPQLRTYRESVGSLEAESSQDEVSGTKSARVHPAIGRLYRSLETQLPAYDRSTCESLAWTHKYAPVTASQLLQTGKEGSLLRQWLEALKVQSVDTGDSGGKTKAKSEGAAKKKRKKNKLDGFVVDSDDEADKMGETSDDEDDWSPAGPGRPNKTVVRSSDASRWKEKGRLANAVVLSGPHGSGKTAAAYAVAKELGFEVFEINSSSRRSGRDIMERVGDMTRNHLVQQHRAEEGPAEASAEVDKDVKSGKQGMMTAFFKPKAGEGKQAPKGQQKEKAGEEAKSSAPKAQKQSLILLEEVDILYEEDKQLWATLMSLMAQSKRPFIMTCNDENLVPLQSLNLHGIFRLSPPPVDVAVDVCLLIAANEGHALKRPAVEALYEARNSDLRATITDLNYWCQIGVGDRRGGFDWFYLRWPKGTDVDGNGDVVRVVSESTYQKGMGWVSRDQIVSTPDRLEVEDEALRQAWHFWQLDAGDWQDTLDMGSWAETVPEDGKARLSALEAYDGFCDSMSAADACSSGGFGVASRELLDASLPDLPGKARDDYTVGRTLLETGPLVRQASPNVDLCISVQSLARSVLHHFSKGASKTAAASPLGPVDEDKTVAILESSFRASLHSLSRHDLSLAFDPIAASDRGAPSGNLLDPSVFDRTLSLIVHDVAPWVRGIVRADHRLMQERLRLSSLLSEGGGDDDEDGSGGGGAGKRKRMRTTRSAYSALEGGERRTTRRQRYFGDRLATGLVMRTGGERWQDAVGEAAAPVEEEAVQAAGSGSEDGLSSA